MTHKEQLASILNSLGLTYTVRMNSFILPSNDRYGDNRDIIEDQTSLDGNVVLELSFDNEGELEKMIFLEED